LQYKVANQRIKKKFKLLRNQDLLNQIQEFKKNPLIKIDGTDDKNDSL